MKREVIATSESSALIKFQDGDKVFYGLYRRPMDTVYLHTSVNYFTRFYIFYENDESMHKDILAQVDKAACVDKSHTGLSL